MGVSAQRMALVWHSMSSQRNCKLYRRSADLVPSDCMVKVHQGSLEGCAVPNVVRSSPRPREVSILVVSSRKPAVLVLKDSSPLPCLESSTDSDNMWEVFELPFKL